MTIKTGTLVEVLIDPTTNSWGGRIYLCPNADWSGHYYVAKGDEHLFRWGTGGFKVYTTSAVKELGGNLVEIVEKYPNLKRYPQKTWLDE